MAGIVDTDLFPELEYSEITSISMMGPRHVESTPSNNSGGGDGSEASCPWSLTHDQQVHNLKENWTRVFTFIGTKMFLLSREDCETIYSFFETIVSNLRDDPYLNSCKKLEKEALILRERFGFVMTSLDLAILMGDLKMVQKILERRFDLGKLLSRVPTYPKRRSKRWSTLSTDDGNPINNLHTPLHLAIVVGDSNIVDVLLEKGANVNAPNWFNEAPLDLACKMGSIDMLKQLLAKDTEEGIDPFHIAVRYGDFDFIKKLSSPNVNVLDKKKKTSLHYLAGKLYDNIPFVTNILQYLAQDKALDVKALDLRGYSAFYVAVCNCNTEVVIALLDTFKDQIQLNEACDKERGPPIQIAFEGGDAFKDIRNALMECDPVKGYMERLYRDRQVYVDAANAILVGTALIASVTFASWLQPPLNYTSYFGEGHSSSLPTPSTSNYNYVDVEHNIALRAFWVFNALSLYFAIGTVVCGARSVLPIRHLFIKKIVEKLQTNLLVTSILLACSVLFVIIAFAIAGTIVLTPLLKYQWCMIVPTIVGRMVCMISLGYLVKSMVENYFWKDKSYSTIYDGEIEVLGCTRKIQFIATTGIKLQRIG